MGVTGHEHNGVGTWKTVKKGKYKESVSGKRVHQGCRGNKLNIGATKEKKKNRTDETNRKTSN